MSNKNFKRSVEELRLGLREITRLSNEEKENMREFVFQYVDEHPFIDKNVTESYAGFKYSLWMRFAVPVAVVVILFGGIGASMAAEGSLPGDFLYPIKVSFNENIRGALAFGDKAQESWKLRQIERRFEEIGALAKKGKIEEKSRITLENRLNQNIDALGLLATDFESENKEEAAQGIYIALGNILEKNDRFLNAQIGTDNSRAFMQTGVLSVALSADDEDINEGLSVGIVIKDVDKIKAKAKISEISRRIEIERDNLEKTTLNEIGELQKEMVKAYENNEFNLVIDLHIRIKSLLNNISSRNDENDEDRNRATGNKEEQIEVDVFDSVKINTDSQNNKRDVSKNEIDEFDLVATTTEGHSREQKKEKNNDRTDTYDNPLDFLLPSLRTDNSRASDSGQSNTNHFLPF